MNGHKVIGVKEMIAKEKCHGFLSNFFFCNNHKEYSKNGVDNIHVIIYEVYLAIISNEAV